MPKKKPTVRDAIDVDVIRIKAFVRDAVRQMAAEALARETPDPAEAAQLFAARVGSLAVVALDRLDVLYVAVQQVTEYQVELERLQALLIARLDQSQVYQ